MRAIFAYFQIQSKPLHEKMCSKMRYHSEIQEIKQSNTTLVTEPIIPYTVFFQKKLKHT